MTIRVALFIIVVVVVFLSGCSVAQHNVVSHTVSCCQGRSTIRYHYVKNNNVCRDTFVILGVGTAMKTEQYDGVAGSMVTAAAPAERLVVFVLDAEPHRPMKLEPKPFARAVDALLQELSSGSLPDVTVCDTTAPTVVVGGHSASGAAAWYAAQNQYFTEQPIAGYIGLDPFSIHGGGDIAPKQSRTIASTSDSHPLRSSMMGRSSSPLPVPSVYWGFQETTCAVTIEHAAWAAYNQTHAHRRALYQLQTGVSNLSHCCFADHGCMQHICACSSTASDVLHRDVGRSIQTLLRHIASGRQAFVPDDFQGHDFELEASSYRVFLDDASSYITPSGTNSSTPADELVTSE